ncbi:hypothetical protein vseg_008933 [Gypsophila vaccaria]
MVAGKVKQAIGLTPKQPNPIPKPKPKPKPKPIPPPPSSTKSFTRSLGAYFPRSSAQVQPHDLDDLRRRESRLLSENSDLRRRESRLISEASDLRHRVAELAAEIDRLVDDRDSLKAAFAAEIIAKDAQIVRLISEVDEVKQLASSHRFLGLVEAANKSTLIKNLTSRHSSSSSSSSSSSLFSTTSNNTTNNNSNNSNNSYGNNDVKCEDNSVELSSVHCRVPRVPKPPPKRCVSTPSLSPENMSAAAPPPPPPPPPTMKKSPAVSVTRPPPPPPMPVRGSKVMTAKVKRVPEVVEFYHSLMRRDTRREAGVGTAEATAAASAKDLVGEIENRSVYLLAIKTDVETQGDFIRFLIKEVESAAFADIEDVVSFVKWLDDELSYLVDERAVLKHFDWPEQKADGLREAAFEYSDLKKLESEASSFRHDARQACSTTLKKMQALLEKLEHGAYNLSRLRESATNRFKSFHIPVDWMLDTGFISQIKLASVKLAMKYMKRVLAELEIVGGGPEEEELIVQGVRFAFRVHQFAGGFDVETMTAFQELRDKARSYHVQSQNQQQQILSCRSMP